MRQRLLDADFHRVLTYGGVTLDDDVDVRVVDVFTREQVAEASNALAWALWNRKWRSPDEIAARCHYYLERNNASYESRKRKAKLRAQIAGET